MSDQFQDDIYDTIERCRRLASSTRDMEMASKLLKMAEDLEKALRHSTGKATHRNKD
jgi:hypothetical protein